MLGSTDLDNFNRDSFKVEITLGSMRNPWDKYLCTNSLWVDNKAKSLIVDGIITGDLKYYESTFLIIGYERIEALANRAEVLDRSKGLGDDVIATTISDIETGLLVIFVDF